jgi:hypothetical protein
VVRARAAFIKGFILDDERVQQGTTVFGKDDSKTCLSGSARSELLGWMHLTSVAR